MKEAKEFLLNNNFFNENDNVIVAVSGGPDSMALLHVLKSLNKKINIICAHVNHNVRKESEKEKKFVEKYCKDNNITFEYMKIEKYTDDIFSENEARVIRYDFFDKLMKKYNSTILLTAHHGDDLIETVLMRLVRGSSLKGYAGFSKIYEVNNYKIIRPFIFYTKSDIEKYIKKNDIPYVIDLSNEKDEYTRNRYRHFVLPFLKKEDENVNTKFLKFSEMLLEYDKFVENEMKKELNKVYVNNKILVDKFLKLDKLIQKRIISYILYQIYFDDIPLIKDNHYDLIYSLICNKKPNLKVILPNNIVVIREYNNIYFTNDNVSFNKNDNKIVLNKDIKYEKDEFIFNKDTKEDNNYICRLNSSEIKLPLYIRQKKDGDKMYVKGMSHTKKIKDIFINEKIAIKDRQKWPIVVDSNDNIVWLPGLKKSKYNKAIDEKYDIIVKYVIKEEK